MKHFNRLIAVLLLILAALQVAACTGDVESAPQKIEPAEVVPIEGTELNRLILTEKAP